ncbi:MAG TPA: type IV toxin-antitoxin system AbiEi family antitoxin domain-containing protein [Streptosporangiaceae bacterium]|nr:type IV toxin-antitoxin system AbiEi family antitoxin domain-containing protein [Streptosporangiaceae bacterium]
MDLVELPGSYRFAGITTTAELAAAGVTDAKIRALVRNGALDPVCRGAYARADLAAPARAAGARTERMLSIAAAVAVAGETVVASHHDAAVVHGLDLLERPPVGRVAVSRALQAPGSRTARPGVAMHQVSLPDAHVRFRDGIPVTSVARTVVDLARTLPFRSGVVVADSALHGFQIGKGEIEGVVRDCARWPGIAKARRVVAFSDALAESPFESIARVVAFHEGGLPPPMLQVWIKGPDRAIGRVDFLWDQHTTIAEADGALKYADPGRAREQLKRDAELRRAGYEVVHFTWRDLAAGSEQVIGWIKAAFGRSARLRAVR